jgi:uncharacterized damage-inducible protein DinB
MGGPGLDRAIAAVPKWETDADGIRHAVEDSVPADNAAALVEWLESSWEPVAGALDQWTAADLDQSYVHRFNGVDYRVSRQWTIWRIMAHDIHHGGQIAMMLAIQGIDAFELRALGGHIIEPPRAAE